MNNVRVVLWAVAVAMCGCADDGGDEPGENGGSPRDPISCTATITPTSFTYEIVDGGRRLAASSGGTQETIERVGAPSAAIYGNWLIGDRMVGDITVRGELQFAPGEMHVVSRCTARGRTVAATATSPATITDQSVTVLQADVDVQYIP